MEAIKQTVKTFILEEFLPGEDPAALTDTVPLITGGVLDSLATLRFVMFLEETYGIEIAPHEVSADHMNTVEDIARLVHSKLGQAAA